MKSKQLDGKNAIITGSRSGIGQAVLRLFAQNGCNCWALVHREDDEFLKEIKILEEQYGVWIKPIYVELTSDESIREGISEIIKERKCY